jgi:hypothetical protein
MKEQKAATVSRSAAGVSVSVGASLGRSVPLSRNYAE